MENPISVLPEPPLAVLAIDGRGVGGAERGTSLAAPAAAPEILHPDDELR